MTCLRPLMASRASKRSCRDTPGRPAKAVIVADGRTNPRLWRRCPHLGATPRCSDCGAIVIEAIEAAPRSGFADTTYHPPTPCPHGHGLRRRIDGRVLYCVRCRNKARDEWRMRVKAGADPAPRTGRPPMSPDLVASILALTRSGMTMRNIAGSLGTSATSVHRIVHRP